MKLYSHFGFNDFGLCLGYRGNMIKEYFLNYEAMNNDFTISLGKKSEIKFNGEHEEQDFKVTLADTGQATLTGGRLLRMKRFVTDDTFMLTYGDGLSNVNITELLEFHKSHGKLATITTVQPNSRFGLLEADEEGSVLEFTEKPKLEGWANVGYFVFNRAIFDYLQDDLTILERQPLEKLAAEKQLMCFRHQGFFFAMDTYREYLHLNELWAAGKAPWKVWK